MSFKEQFPSLKDKERDMVEIGPPDDPSYEYDLLFTEGIIMLNCLDKAKLRKDLFYAIHKRNWPIIVDEDGLLEELYEELGLE